MPQLLLLSSPCGSNPLNSKVQSIICFKGAAIESTAGHNLICGIANFAIPSVLRYVSWASEANNIVNSMPGPNHSWKSRDTQPQ